MTGVHIEDQTREGGGTSPRWTTAVKPSSAGYTWGLEPGHSGSAKPAKATELQAPCVFNYLFWDCSRRDLLALVDIQINLKDIIYN